MARFSRLRAGWAIVAAACLVGGLASGPVAKAGGRSRHTPLDACAPKLDGYRPVLESVYEATAGGNIFFLDQVKEDGNGSISGVSGYAATNPLRIYTGTFTGKLNAQTIQGRGSAGDAGWTFSFTGTATCLLSQITTADAATKPSGRLPSTLRLTTACELEADFGPSVPASLLPACKARQVLDGIRQHQWDNGAPIPGNGAVPYSWGGGHPWPRGEGTHGNGTVPGPSYGTCLAGYSGPHNKPLNSCLEFKEGPYSTVGLDCSGFTRWIFYLIMNADVLGAGGTGTQVKLLADGSDTAGDLVYFTNKEGIFNHAGIIIAPGEMIDEPETLAALRVDRITAGYGTPYYKAYHFAVPAG